MERMKSLYRRVEGMKECIIGGGRVRGGEEAVQEKKKKMKKV